VCSRTGCVRRGPGPLKKCVVVVDDLALELEYCLVFDSFTNGGCGAGCSKV
jgi:hypothetical protein